MRYTPFETMERLLEQMRRDLYELGPRIDWTPATNLTEHEDSLILTMDLPGFEKDEIDLRIAADTLFIRAVHDPDDDETGQTRQVTEQVHLARTVDEDAVTASYHNGVLELTLPFSEDALERGHRIEIE